MFEAIKRSREIRSCSLVAVITSLSTGFCETHENNSQESLIISVCKKDF